MQDLSKNTMGTKIISKITQQSAKLIFYYILYNAILLILSTVIINQFPINESTFKLVSFFRGIGFITISSIFLYILIKNNLMLLNQKGIEAEINLQMYKALIDNTQDLIWLYEIKTQKFKYLSPSFYKLRGYSTEEMTESEADQINRFLYDDYLPRIMAKLDKHKEQKSGTLSDLHILHVPTKDGSVIPVEVKTTFIRDAYDNTVDILGVGRDIEQWLRNQKALKDAEENLRETFQKNPLPLVIYELETYKILSVNNAAIVKYDYSLEEFTSMTIFDMRPPEDIAVVKERIKSLDENNNDLGVWRHKKKNGEILYVQILSTLLKFNNKRCRLSQIIDVTDKLKVEEELRRGEERYRNLFMNNPLPMWIYEMHTYKFLYVNNAAIKKYGYSVEEFKRMTLFDIRPKEYHDALTKTFKEITNKEHRAGAWKHVTKDGQLIYIDIVSTPLMFNGRDARLVLLNDVTEKLRLEKEALENQHFIESVLKFAPITIFIRDIKEKQNIFFNDSVYKLTGRNKDDLPSPPEEFFSDFNNFVHPDDLTFLREEQAKDNLLSDNGLLNYVFRLIKPDNSIAWINTWMQVFSRDAEGRPERLIGIMQDFTKEKEAEDLILKSNEILEEKVNERTNELIELNKELESFTYTVSHDLKAPLRGISGFAKILYQEHKDRFNDEMKELLDDIMKNSKRMNVLIEDLLRFSRLSKRDIVKNKIDSNSLIENVIFEVLSYYPNSNIQFTKNSCHTIFGDFNLIRQVFFNLINNAAKFSNKNNEPKVNIYSEIKDGFVIFCIEDNGVGFDNKYLGKLFGVFNRLHAMTEFEGNGVGLAIVKRIIEKHNGKVWADGKLGEGAKFFFSIPL